MSRLLIAIAAASLLAACGSADTRDTKQPGTETKPTEAGPPVALELRTADTEFLVGTEVQLEVVGIDADGNEVDVTEGVTFTSSDERVATVDTSGLVKLIAGGPVQFTARAAELEASLDARPTCTYPANTGLLDHGEVVPPLSWPAKRADGTEFELRLEDVYCDADWAHVDTLALLFYAGWCPYCTEMAQELDDTYGALNDKGMELLFVLVETTGGQPAGLDFAWEHMERVTDVVPGFVVGDAQTKPAARFIADSGIVRGFPTNVVVRTSDMRVITGRRWTATNIPLDRIATNPDGDWGLFHGKCSSSQQEASEPNDRTDQAAAIGAGTQGGGICSEGDVDHFLVDLQGTWRAELTWQAASTDELLLSATSIATGQPGPAAAPITGGLGEGLSLTMTGPARLQIKTRQTGGSGTYGLSISAQ